MCHCECPGSGASGGDGCHLEVAGAEVAVCFDIGRGTCCTLVSLHRPARNDICEGVSGILCASGCMAVSGHRGVARDGDDYCGCVPLFRVSWVYAQETKTIFCSFQKDRSVSQCQ